MHFTYPKDVQTAFTEPFRVFALDIIALTKLACWGIGLEFFTAWSIRIFAPIVLSLGVVLIRFMHYARTDRHAARIRLRSEASFFLFFCAKLS